MTVIFYTFVNSISEASLQESYKKELLAYLHCMASSKQGWQFFLLGYGILDSFFKADKVDII